MMTGFFGVFFGFNSAAVNTGMHVSFFKIISTFNYYLFIFLAVLGLHFCARASSSCGKQGPLFIAVRGPHHYHGLSCCGAQDPDAQAQ